MKSKINNKIKKNQRGRGRNSKSVKKHDVSG